MAKKSGPSKSVCPSEVARDLFAETWRSYLDEVNMAAVKLNKEGKIKATQKGKEVNLDSSKGPVRLSITEDD